MPPVIVLPLINERIPPSPNPSPGNPSSNIKSPKQEGCLGAGHLSCGEMCTLRIWRISFIIIVRLCAL